MPETDQYTDTQIIEHILNGQTALFEILIRRNNPFLYKTGRAYNYSHEDTQDLMQETFIDAYKNLSGFKNLSAFKTWIIRIMLNHCYRKNKNRLIKMKL
jgi:RNA polymerase sigma-70 factor (ECF subfamily)